MKKKREEGFLLVTVYWLLTFLVIFAVAGAAFALADLRAAQRLQANVRAFYLAEAGIDQAIVNLRSNYLGTSDFTGEIGTPGSYGTYAVDVDVDGNKRTLTVVGAVVKADPADPNEPLIQRKVEAIVERPPPDDRMGDNVIWAPISLDFNGNSYEVEGSVLYADTTPSSTNNVNGPVTYDPTANPLPRLNFEALRDIAQAQNNIYDAARIGNGQGVFPTSFWYRPPGTNGPEDPGEPNVNYITADLFLRGNIGTIGGFFVVVGNVLTDASTTENNTDVDGNGEIAGAIYTAGSFEIKGGGNGLNIDGGVWAGNEVRLDGNAKLRYNAEYMNAVPLPIDVQLKSWWDKNSE